jgi:hypothetical protein
MKLYTEFEIKFAMDIARCQPDKTFDEVLEELTPIQLPSDEEIREERLLQFPDSEYVNRANDRLAFYCGAKYVLNKIQGGNK